MALTNSIFAHIIGIADGQLVSRGVVGEDGGLMDRAARIVLACDAAVTERVLAGRNMTAAIVVDRGPDLAGEIGVSDLASTLIARYEKLFNPAAISV